VVLDVNATWKDVVVKTAAPVVQPFDQAVARLFGQLELDWLPGLLLHDRGAVTRCRVDHKYASSSTILPIGRTSPASSSGCDIRVNCRTC